MSFPRYPSYKDSGVPWLGEVPGHWDCERLNAVASCNDEVLSENTPDDYEIEYVEISGVEAGRGIVEVSTLPFGSAPSRARRVLRDGDILISTVRTYLRAIAQVNDPPPNMIASTGFAVLRPRSVDSRYLGYACNAEGFVGEVIARSVGVSYPAINASELVRLPVPLPPVGEQRAIATFLDRETAKIDALVAEQQVLIGLLKEKRQAVISHAVTKGLDPSVTMKDSGVEWLGEVPAHWETVPLKHFTYFSGGGTPSRDNLEFWGGNIPWVSPKDMKVEDLADAEERITLAGLNSSAASLIKPGAILMVVRSGILKHTIPVGINSVEVALNQDMKALTFDSSKCTAKFFLRWVQGLNEQLLLAWSKQGATVESIEHAYLAETVLALPTIREQSAIATFLDRETAQLHALTAEAQSAITLLQERRSALISAAVTGQIDVRQALPA